MFTVTAVVARSSTWESIGTRRSRTLESVILPQGMARDFMQDARNFKASAGWYADRGIPYRRGYLIYGTPGSGKTSLITAVAGELRLNICILNLSVSINFDSTPSHHRKNMSGVLLTLLYRASASITFSAILDGVLCWRVYMGWALRILYWMMASCSS